MPVLLTGADSLNARVSWQQERATQLAKDAASIKSSHETIQELYEKSRNHVEDIKRKHGNQRKRLLNVMRKVEIVRCMNHSLQPDEVRVMERLRHLNAETAQVRQHLAELEGWSRASRPQHGAVANVDLPDREQLHKVLTGHHDKLASLTLQMQKDLRDVKLIKDRVVPPGPGR
jgi:predicted nuclease with TOPRIM domain